MLSSVLLMFGTAAENGSDARYNDLGHRMLCTCEGVPAAGMGLARCQQVMLECTHLNCNVSGRMSAELKAALQRGYKDDVILQSFVQEYGTSVLVTSPAIDKLVWVVASVAVIAIVSFVVVFVRKRRPVN